MLHLTILIVALLFTAYLTNYFLVRSFLGIRWRIFVAPGVIIHELSHAFACILTFTKVIKISFFDKEGGSVTHQKSPIPIIGPIIISAAPLAIGIVIFYFLGKAVNFSHWQNIIIVYLLLSIAVTMTPSVQDLINMLWPLIIIIAIFYLFHFQFLIFLTPVLTLVIYILLACLAISLILYLLTKLILRR